jgi:hypothetical protein
LIILIPGSISTYNPFIGFALLCIFAVLCSHKDVLNTYEKSISKIVILLVVFFVAWFLTAKSQYQEHLIERSKSAHHSP